MKANGTRYSPEFKLQVVLEVLKVLKAKAKGAEVQVAQAYGAHPVTLAKWNKQFWGMGKEPLGMIVDNDQDSVYASYRWLWKLLIEDNVVVSYCERGARDNPRNEIALGAFQGRECTLLPGGGHC